LWGLFATSSQLLLRPSYFFFAHSIVKNIHSDVPSSVISSTLFHVPSSECGGKSLFLANAQSSRLAEGQLIFLR
jgi:hypothetical protein